MIVGCAEEVDDVAIVRPACAEVVVMEVNGLDDDSEDVVDEVPGVDVVLLVTGSAGLDWLGGLAGGGEREVDVGDDVVLEDAVELLAVLVEESPPPC